MGICTLDKLIFEYQALVHLMYIYNQWIHYSCLVFVLLVHICTNFSRVCRLRVEPCAHWQNESYPNVSVVSVRYHRFSSYVAAVSRSTQHKSRLYQFVISVNQMHSCCQLTDISLSALHIFSVNPFKHSNASPALSQASISSLAKIRTAIAIRIRVSFPQATKVSQTRSSVY